MSPFAAGEFHSASAVRFRVAVRNGILTRERAVLPWRRAARRFLSGAWPALFFILLSSYSPALSAATSLPDQSALAAGGEPAKFLLNDVYAGLSGVKRGEVRKLRVVETTARASGAPQGGPWWKQSFLVSWQGADNVKNFLGVVPVEADGSVCFEAPPGRALSFQALDKDGRLIRAMRTTVSAAPGVTRSCHGCHARDYSAPPAPLAAQKPPAQIKPESWGRGGIDYPTMIQPILDAYCVKCHGGEDGIAAGLDYSGGWTWAFNISYETMLKNSLTGFLNGENSASAASESLSARKQGSAVAPLAEQLASGHHGRLRELPQSSLDLLLAWMDGNCGYHGNWDYSEHATCDAILPLRDKLLTAMDQAGCLRCHQKEIGSDWINLAAPEYSRLLRAPLAKDPRGLALSWCRDRPARRVRWPLITMKQQAPDVLKPARVLAPKLEGPIVRPFPDTEAPGYRSLLAIIQQGREEALQKPRVDMPGAVIIHGQGRPIPPLPAVQPGSNPHPGSPPLRAEGPTGK